MFASLYAYLRIAEKFSPTFQHTQAYDLLPPCHDQSPVKKTYKPRQVKMPGILDHLPVPPSMVQRLNSDMSNRMLRLRLSGCNGKDLATVVVGVGEAWLLAGLMEQGAELRQKLEAGVDALDKDILKDAADLHGSTYDTLFDLTSLTSAIVAASTKKEYLLACDRLKSDGVVPFVDEFLVTLAKANLLEVIKSAKPEDSHAD